MKYESYQKISTATKDLRNATKITERRKAADSLKKLLSDKSLRTKLAQDAISAAREQKKTSTRYLLQKIYSNVIRAGLHAANASLSSRISKKNEDVMLPYKLFSLVDMDSDAVLNAKNKKSKSMFFECEPFTFESFDRYRGTNDTLTHVSSKDICELLAFCLKCLEDDDIRHLAEVDLLNALQKLCSRSDYVAHYHPYHDVLSIMTTVNYTLNSDKSGGGMCSALAARAFYNLFHQLIMSLDIDTSLHVESALSLILDWVRRSSSNVGVAGVSDSSQIATYMFGVASDIMTEHPDRCISILASNNFGLDLFRNARKRWDYCRGQDKHALVMFFSSHIYVCEFAGNLQGMLPGDLGNVGNASLDRLKLEQLKDMLLSENNLEVYASSSKGMHDESGQSRLFKRDSRSNKRRKITSGNDQERFQPLHEQGRKYLELCARVLRSLQRRHVIDMEVKSTDNLSDYIMEHNANDSEEGQDASMQHDICSWVSQSPFFENVGSKCFGSIVVDKMRDSSSMESEISPSPLHDNPSESVGRSDGLLTLPMLASMLDLSVSEPTDEKMIVYLQLIGACAEVFPRGECWTSSNGWYQTDFSPMEWNGESFNPDQVTYCNVCSIQDLAAIVYSLSLVLIRYSSASSNQQVQMWTLICLLKMTDASHIVRRYLGAKCHKDELSVAWRYVWDILLNFEYRYHSTTAQAEPCTVGELVLMLLTEIMRGALMNSYQDDLLENQDKIWSIPAFSNPIDVKVSAGLELAAFVVHCLGIVEGESESICNRCLDPSLQQLFKKESENGRERHYRLVSFCMQCLTLIGTKNDVMLIRRIGPFLSSMCVALMHGSIAKNLTSYTLKAERELQLTSGVFNLYAAHQRFLDNRRNMEKSHLLWDDSIHPFSSQYHFETNWFMWNKLNRRNKSNCPLYSLSDRLWLSNVVENQLVLKQVQSGSKTKIDLKDFATHYILQWIDHDRTNTTQKLNCVSITHRIVGIKIALSISLCGEDPLQNKIFSIASLESSVHSIVRDVSSEVQNFSSNDVQHALIEMTGILRFVRMFLPLERGKYLSGILPTKLCARLYEMCRETIIAHKDRKSINSDDNGSHRNLKTLQSFSHHLSKDDVSISSSEDNESNFNDLKDGSTFSVSSSKNESLLCPDRNATQKRTKNLQSATYRGVEEIDIDSEFSASFWRGQVQWICIQIMLLIQPSSRTIGVIASMLLRTDITDKECQNETFEPHDHLLFLGMISKFILISHASGEDSQQTEREDEDAIQTLIIETILDCREMSQTSSPMLLLGFGLCNYLVGSNSSSSESVDQVLQVLLPDGSVELRLLQNRPALRLAQVRAATKCFMSGSANFHRRFDNIFATQFVLESLQHHKQCIRQAGLEALGSALKLFPEKFQAVIAADALALFPPKPAISDTLYLFHVLSEKHNVTDSASFVEWAEKRTKSADFPDLKKKGWIHIRVAVETDKVRCIAQICKHTTDEVVARSAVLALLYISKSEKQRSISLASLDSITKTLKFASVELMLEHYQAHFFHNWSMMNLSFLSIPIVLSSTLAARNLLRLVDCPQISICDQDMVENAAKAYINKNVHSILPVIFLCRVDEIQEAYEIISENDSSQDHSDFASNTLYKHIYEIANKCCDRDIRSIVIMYFHEIYAYLLPVIVMGSDDLKELKWGKSAKAATNFLHLFIKDMNKMITRKAPSIIFDLINLMVKRHMIPNSDFCSGELLFRSIRHISDLIITQNMMSSVPNIFQVISLSPVEVILYIKTIIEKATDAEVRHHGLESLSIVIDLVLTIPSANVQSELDFAIGSLLSICSKSECDEFRAAVVLLLETLVRRMVGNGNRDSLIPIKINKLVAFLIQFHQQNISSLVDFFQASRKFDQMHKRICLPLMPIDGDASRALQTIMLKDDPDCHVLDFDKMLGGEKMHKSLESITACIESSYNSLAIILDTTSGIFTKLKTSVDKLPVLTNDTPFGGILRSISEKCNVNRLLEAFEDARKGSETRTFMDKVKLLCARCTTVNRGLRDGLGVRRGSEKKVVSTMSHEIESLRLSLYQVNEELQRYILDGSATSDISAQLLIVGKEVSALCCNELPSDLQEATTKCLGYLGSIFQFYKTEGDFTQGKAGKKHLDNPLASVYSSASRLLVNLLQGDDVDTANHAKDTIKFLVTTTDGRYAFQNSDIPPECRQILSSFMTNDARRASKVPGMSKSFYKKTLSLAHNKHNSSSSWCWVDNFWRLPYELNLSYDEWIRHIVCAMILCCYDIDGRDRNRPIKGTSMFVPGCLSMCARDHKFASIIFPGIIYDILDSDCSEVCEDNPLFTSRKWMVGSAMSLANKTLSHCFSKILNSYNGSHQCIKIDQKYDSIRTITNVIHTLNFLRITTERRFMKAAHPRNFISSIKGRTFHKENGVYTCSEKVSNYNKVEGPPLWSGRPYGVVLNLSGIELSQAYLKSHDYINALFYAEFFADNQLGSSGNTFEQLRTLDCVQNSISGFGQPHTSFIENMKERPVNKSQLAIKFHSILEQCLSELHEDDALAGLEYQTCRIRFDHPQFFSASRNHVLRTMTPSEAMVTLMRLDNAAQEQSREAAFNDRLVLSSCMTQIGLRYVSRMFMSGTCATDFNSKLDQKKISEQWAEESWRLFQWEHFRPSDEKEFNISRWKQEDAWAPFYNKHDSTQTTGYHMSLKHSIHSLLENDLPNVWLHLSASRSSLIEDFNTSLRPKVQNRELCSLALKACTLNELEDLGLVCSTKMSPDAWLGKYCSNSSIFSNLSNLNMQFDELESSMAAHEVFLKVLYKKFGDNPCDHIGSTLTKHLWGVCRLARDSKKPNVALSALKRLRGFFKVESECSTLTLKYNLEEAKITQLFGNTSTSVQFCKEIITRLAAMEPLKRTNDENILLIQTQLQCAEWLTDYSIESNAIILDDLLKPAAHGAWMLYDKDKVKPSLVASSNYALGSFAANLYDSVQKRVNSHAWKLLGDAARGRQRQLEELKETVKMKRKSKSVDYRVSEYEYITLEKEVLMDSKERESVENSVEQYLELAIESFGRALSTSSCSFHDTKHVFQFISLWFRNCSNDSDINDIVSGWLLKIPSYHFVPLIYQIFSRVDMSIDPARNSFQSVLQNLVCNICIEHPYHGIIQLIALANGNNVVRSKKEDMFTANVQKVEAVKKILQRIRNNKFVQKGMQKNIHFSNIREISKHLQLPRCLRSRSQYMPCILTKPPKVQADANYGNGDTDPIGSERIQSFESSFSLTDSGIHRPKIVVCRGSCGGSFKQLVKGDDDIRQDAVMQQVFSSMNVFLKNEKKEALGGRDLRLITYRCVPLSPATGVLEWVENTIPIGTYLTTSATGAHDRYYPGEWGNSLCRLHMQCSPPSQKRASFDEVCRHYSPSFRFFFLENFSTPQLWHHARMIYTRSCAVSSMVGHILGIGDRHTQNILIKQNTGEIVHIDFGIVFEQGKVLPTPETIPFRLTRNIVDGMGPLGTEGVFTAAARATTRVLRDNSNAILTILAAVVSDPLYSWRVSTAKGRQVQYDNTTQVGENEFRGNKLSDTNPTLSILDSDNDAATRAIARIHEKLKGYEEGTLGEQQTVESQVRFLVNQARDPDKLCNLYAGWAPWV